MATLPPISKTSTFGTTTVHYEIYSTKSDQCPGTTYLSIDTKTTVPVEGNVCDIHQQLDERLRGLKAAREYVVQLSKEIEGQILQQLAQRQAVKHPPTPPPLPPAPTPWNPPETPSAAVCAEIGGLVPAYQCPPEAPGARRQWPQAPERDPSRGGWMPDWAGGPAAVEDVPSPEFCMEIEELATRQQCPEAAAGARRQWARAPGDAPAPGSRPGWAGGPTEEVFRRPWSGYEGPTRARAAAADMQCPRWATQPPPAAPPVRRGLPGRIVSAPQPTRTGAYPKPKPQPPATKPPWRSAGTSAFFGQTQPSFEPPHRRGNPPQTERQTQPQSSDEPTYRRLGYPSHTARRAQLKESDKSNLPPSFGRLGFPQRTDRQPHPTRAQSTSAFSRGMPPSPPRNVGLVEQGQEKIEDIVEKFNLMEETAFGEVQSHGGQQTSLNQSMAALAESTSTAP